QFVRPVLHHEVGEFAIAPASIRYSRQWRVVGPTAIDLFDAGLDSRFRETSDHAAASKPRHQVAALYSDGFLNEALSWKKKNGWVSLRMLPGNCGVRT